MPTGPCPVSRNLHRIRPFVAPNLDVDWFIFGDSLTRPSAGFTTRLPLFDAVKWVWDLGPLAAHHCRYDGSASDLFASTLFGEASPHPRTINENDYHIFGDVGDSLTSFAYGLPLGFNQFSESHSQTDAVGRLELARSFIGSGNSSTNLENSAGLDRSINPFPWDDSTLCAARALMLAPGNLGEMFGAVSANKIAVQDRTSKAVDFAGNNVEVQLLSSICRRLWQDGVDPDSSAAPAPSGAGRLQAIWPDVVLTHPQYPLLGSLRPYIITDLGSAATIPANESLIITNPLYMRVVDNGDGSYSHAGGHGFYELACSSWDPPGWVADEAPDGSVYEADYKKCLNQSILDYIDLMTWDRARQPIFVKMEGRGTDRTGTALTQAQIKSYTDQWIKDCRSYCASLGRTNPIFLLISPHLMFAGGETDIDDIIAANADMPLAYDELARENADVAYVSLAGLMDWNCAAEGGAANPSAITGNEIVAWLASKFPSGTVDWGAEWTFSVPAGGDLTGSAAGTHTDYHGSVILAMVLREAILAAAGTGSISGIANGFTGGMSPKPGIH